MTNQEMLELLYLIQSGVKIEKFETSVEGWTGDWDVDKEHYGKPRTIVQYRIKEQSEQDRLYHAAMNMGNYK